MESNGDTRTLAPYWLDVSQQADWRSFIMGAELLLSTLDRELREAHQLPITEYEVLVRLSEQPDGRMRMATLADSTSHSRSRMTHTVARMEKSGWVQREAVSNDGRGVLAVMTEEGREMLHAAAPTHVAGVRKHLIDRIDPDDLKAIGRAFNVVCDELAAHLPASADLRN